jgi:2'-5' RNA ligase
VSADRARLFVALELPEEVRYALVAWQKEAVAGLGGVRPIAGKDLHVTLCFLGWRLQSELGAIVEACGVVAGHPAPALSLGDAVALPRRRPRVLAVALGDPDGKLTATQGALSAALHAGGWYEPERRPYLPHVTVARVGRAARLRRATLSPPPLRFHADGVTLYRSRTYRAGARYEPLSQLSLASPS